MTEPVDFGAYKKEHEPKCVFCGNTQHRTTLTCPRVSGVDIDSGTGEIIGVRFWPEFNMQDLDDGPPAA